MAEEKKPMQGERQTDLAEGEESTVDESIRAHEKKGDQQGKPATKKNPLTNAGKP